ncbi:MAG: hypothetical protein SNJ82_01555 [Gemmataceae bacterium]
MSYGGLAVLAIVGGLLGLMLSGPVAKPGPQAGLNPIEPNPPIPNPTPNLGIPKPGIPKRGIPNPGIPNPGILNPGILNPGIPNPGIPNPGIPNPGPLPNPPLPNPTPSLDVVQSMPEALTLLRSKNPFVMRKAFDYLAKTKPDPKHFKEVSDTVGPLIDDPLWFSTALQVLPQWANSDLIPHLKASAEKPNNHYRIALMVPIFEKLLDHNDLLELVGKLAQDRHAVISVMPLLKKAGKKAEPHLLAVLNHTDRSMANQAEDALKSLGVSEIALRKQSIKDLSHEDRGTRLHAMQRLGRSSRIPLTPKRSVRRLRRC